MYYCNKTALKNNKTNTLILHQITHLARFIISLQLWIPPTHVLEIIWQKLDPVTILQSCNYFTYFRRKKEKRGGLHLRRICCDETMIA
jgi:hypothetical protein